MAHRTQPGGQANAAALEDNNGKNKGSEFLALDMGSAPQNDQYMQMQMVEGGGSQAYMQQRSSAIESIESTISELGQIFGQLAHMVAEQRDTVQRIDSDVYDVADNVGGAQRELLKYYASVSSNRWLMLKIFGVLIVFFLLFILVSCEYIVRCRFHRYFCADSFLSRIIPTHLILYNYNAINLHLSEDAYARPLRTAI